MVPRSESPRRRALVTGVGGPSGQAAVAALKSRGYPVLAVDMRAVAHEADGFLAVPAARDPHYADALTEVILREDIAWLVPTVSEELVIVSELAPRLRAAGVAVYVGAPHAVRICDDKWGTARALGAAGVPVPRSALGNADSDDVRALGFPLVSRPRVGRGGRGVVVHDGPGVVPEAADPVWQEFLPGTEYDAMLVVDPDSERILAASVFEKTVLKEGRVGNALHVVPAEAPDVARLAREAAAAIGLQGPMDMDIRRGADGHPRVLEVNARIGAHTPKVPAVFDALCTLFEDGNLG